MNGEHKDGNMCILSRNVMDSDNYWALNNETILS